jgi:drug/metabolite transporter (DMT)-like permease
MNRYLLANFAAAAAALSAGASVVATRFVVGETDPVALAFYRYLIGSVCLAPALFLLRPKDGLPMREVAKIAALGVLFFGFFTWAFSAALQYTTAARGAIGLATIPIQTLVLAALFGREALTGRKLASVALAFAGIATVFGPAALAAETTHLRGDGLMLLGAFSAAVYSVFSRSVLGRHGPIFVTALAMAFGALALLPVALIGGSIAGIPSFSREGWLAMLFLGTVGGALQFSLFIWALRWLAPTRTVIYLTLNPITATILAVLLLGEAVTAALATGLLLVIAGILTANLPSRLAVSRPS